jgi:gamma-glutamyltranspeptidase
MMGIWHSKMNMEVASCRMPLHRHGFRLEVRDPHSFYLGCVQMVLQEREQFIGVADPRRDGSAGGPTS